MYGEAVDFFALKQAVEELLFVFGVSLKIEKGADGYYHPGRSAHYVVEVNGERIDAEQTLICVCNGRWYGGGFNPVPEAEPDDGLLDVLLVKKVSLLQVAAVIGKYQKGKYADYPALIRHERCTELTIRCDTPSVVNIDGEALHTDFLDISLKPKALRFFYPKGLSYRLKAE